MRVVIVLPLLLLLTLVPAPAHAQGPVAVFITAAEAAGTGDTVPVNVTVAGGPGEDGGTFTLKAYLQGEDLTGASPLEDSPLEMSSSNKTFDFNVTLPLFEQGVKIVVEVNSSKADQWSVGSSSRRILALVPLRVTARVANQGAVEVRDVPVFLYIDGEQVAKTRLDSLKPGESRVVSLVYVPLGLTSGSHTLEIAVDLNGDGIIDPALGEVVQRMTFVKEAEPINPLWIILGAVGAFVAALIVGAIIRQRRASK